MYCDAFYDDMNSFLRISYVLDFIDKAHVALQNFFFRRDKTILLFLFGQFIFLK